MSVKSPLSLQLTSQEPKYKELLKQKLRIERETKARMSKNPLDYYWPHSGTCKGPDCDHTLEGYNTRQLNLPDGTEYAISGCPQYAFHTSLALTRAIFGGNREVAIDTEVRMSDGSKKTIGELHIGDIVMAWDGKNAVPSKVVDIPYDGNSETWKMTTQGGLSVESSIDHCFPSLSYRKRGIQKHTLQEIKDSKWTHKRMVRPQRFEYSKTVIPFSGLLLGLYLGDGSYGKSPSSGYSRPNFTNEEENIRDLFAMEIRKAYPSLVCRPRPSDLTRLYVRGKSKGKNYFINDLKALGLGGKKCHDKFVPNEYKYGSLETRRGVLEGIILTDGGTDRYKISIYSTSLRQLKDLEEIILSLGGRDKIYKDHEPKNENQKTGYKLQFSIGYVKKMGISGLQRKMPKVELVGETREDDMLVDTISYVGVKRCRCITVEHRNHAFVLANGIVTYNSGKTCAGVVEVGFHMTGEYPDWYPEERRYNRPVKGRIFGSDYAKGVGEVIIPAIDEWLPKSCFAHNPTKNNQGVSVKYHIKHKSGGTSVMDILTYEMDSKQCEGWWGDFVWYDEPPPRTHRVATLRGLTDRLGWEIFTLTPLDQPWLFDEIWENSNPDIETFLMDIRHNLMRQNPKTGKYVGISEKAIERFESVLTDEEKQVRRHGRFTHLAGRIFKGWDRKVHLFNRRDMWTVEGTGSKIDGEPPAHWPRMMLIDPHDRKPDCVIWVTKDPDYGTKYIYRELMNKNSDATFKTTCRDIRDKEVDGRDTVMYRIMDPNFGPKRQGNSGMDVRKTFEAESQNIGYPMRFTFGDDHKELGRKAVNELFWYDKEMPISIINQPGLLIADDCVNCIYQIEHYVWDEYKLGAMEKDVKEKPKDLNTDFPDLLHYMALYNWRDNPAEVSPGCGNAYGGN